MILEAFAWFLLFWLALVLLMAAIGITYVMVRCMIAVWSDLAADYRVFKFQRLSKRIKKKSAAAKKRTMLKNR